MSLVAQWLHFLYQHRLAYKMQFLRCTKTGFEHNVMEASKRNATTGVHKTHFWFSARIHKHPVCGNLDQNLLLFDPFFFEFILS